MSELQLTSAGLTDQGQERSANEDAILNHTGRTKTGENFGLYMVCDGLGGHHAGDVASQMAVQIVARELRPILPPLSPHHISSADINHTIWTAVQRANQEIWYHVENGEAQENGMGTTLTMAVVLNSTVHIAHVGDSRLYLLRNGRLEQLTQDHTMAAALAEAGHISDKEIVDHPRQNILTRALGRQKTVKVELMELPFVPGDTLLLCSDGFWKAFKTREALEKRLNTQEEAAVLCKKLLKEANKLDGSDNISLVIVSAHQHRLDFQQATSSQLEQVRQPVAV